MTRNARVAKVMTVVMVTSPTPWSMPREMNSTVMITSTQAINRRYWMPKVRASPVQPNRETRGLARQLMNAIAMIMVFQSTNSILTKGVLRGGGDTRFLMLADVFFLWVASVPLGMLAGLVWHLPAFFIYFCMKIDQVIKCVWCFFRLRSGKWIKVIDNGER